MQYVRAPSIFFSQKRLFYKHFSSAKLLTHLQADDYMQHQAFLAQNLSQFVAAAVMIGALRVNAPFNSAN